ncbi:MAG TPA: hypothetical protein VFS80_09070 [Burkholderiales bacterium]|nr:hypothetical protein [Burkholderiales bacterium]
MPPEGESRFLTKFTFRIRTRSGTPVENLMVQAADRAQAEGRIQQMYPYCEIVECRELTAMPRDEAASLDSILSLISRNDGEPR